MANDSAKKRVIINRELMQRYRRIILGVNALYVLFRMWYLWPSFSNWHMGGFALTSTIYAACYFMLSKAAAPKYAPLAEGGALISGGEDLGQAGVLEYTWDMLYTTLFVQLATGFLHDGFWLLFTIPPCIGVYFLWTKVIYPWISKPDSNAPLSAEEEKRRAKAEAKAGRVKYSKAR
ncbi:hypothetical protein AB1Y20_007946 [Prymnesium parvum]|uniref:Transmembrane protein 208 n=1 Tax=Prymnesium parvum TaxID=97485 RepID=A0AB34IVC5_PRYPA